MLEKFWLIGILSRTDLGVGGGQGDATPWCALEEALHDEEWLMNFFDGGGVLADGDGESGEADGATVEFINGSFEDAFVHFIEAVAIDFDHGEGVSGDGGGDGAIGADLGKISYPAE